MESIMMYLFFNIVNFFSMQDFHAEIYTQQLNHIQNSQVVIWHSFSKAPFFLSSIKQKRLNIALYTRPITICHVCDIFYFRVWLIYGQRKKKMIRENIQLVKYKVKHPQWRFLLWIELPILRTNIQKIIILNLNRNI